MTVVLQGLLIKSRSRRLDAGAGHPLFAVGPRRLEAQPYIRGRILAMSHGAQPPPGA